MPVLRLLALLLCAASLFADDKNPFTGLPARALPIEGGTVEFQGLVMWDARDPVRSVSQPSLLKYVLVTYDMCDFPIWTQIDWKVPNQAPFTIFGKIEAHRYRDAFLKTKRVTWDSPIPAKVTIYADEKKTRLLGGREIVMQFHEGRERFEAFEAEHEKGRLRVSGDAAMLSGFPEMDLTSRTPGTKVEGWVETFVKLALWKQQSRHHWDCTHAVTAVQVLDPQTVKALERMTVDDQPLSAETKQTIEDARKRSNASFEEWQIRSCDDTSRYLVVVLPLAEKHSMDLRVMKLAD